MAVLALLNGGWMIFDGLHVIKNGKYFGPEKPGPWSRLPEMLGIDPFKIGPFFLVTGFLWLMAIGLLFVEPASYKQIILVPCVLTLWYIPVGTVISVIFGILYFFM